MSYEVLSYDLRVMSYELRAMSDELRVFKHKFSGQIFFTVRRIN